MSTHPTGLQEVEIPALTREAEIKEMWNEVGVAAESAAASWSQGLAHTLQIQPLPQVDTSTPLVSGSAFIPCDWHDPSGSHHFN